MTKFFEINHERFPINTKEEIETVKDILNALEVMAEVVLSSDTEESKSILDYRRRKLIALGDLID